MAISISIERTHITGQSRTTADRTEIETTTTKAAQLEASDPGKHRVTDAKPAVRLLSDGTGRYGL